VSVQRALVVALAPGIVVVACSPSVAPPASAATLATADGHRGEVVDVHVATRTRL
jgi:hypothetical protein